MTAASEIVEPTAMADPFITFRDVEKSFKTKRNTVVALSKFNLEVPRGQFVAVVGPSGCGKSTLLTALAGLTRPTHGAIRVNGAEVDGPIVDSGIVFQNAELLPWRTALQNIMLQAEIRKLDKGTIHSKALDLLGQVGLGDFADKLPDELSGGMRQRVALCRALVHSPSILLMDEPFGALDAITRDQVQKDLQDLWLDRQPTVLFITHSIDEAVMLADRVLVLSPRPGRVVDDISIEIPRPRRYEDRESSVFLGYTHRIRRKFTELGVFDD